MPPRAPAGTLQRLLLAAAGDDRSGLTHFDRTGPRPLESFAEIGARAEAALGNGLQDGRGIGRSFCSELLCNLEICRGVAAQAPT